MNKLLGVRRQAKNEIQNNCLVLLRLILFVYVFEKKKITCGYSSNKFVLSILAPMLLNIIKLNKTKTKKWAKKKKKKTVLNSEYFRKEIKQEYRIDCQQTPYYLNVLANTSRRRSIVRFHGSGVKYLKLIPKTTRWENK